MKLPQNNLNYPVRLMLGSISGSGFIITSSNVLYLVTARHVIYQQDHNTQLFNLIDKKMKMIIYPFVSGKKSNSARVFELDLEKLAETQNLKIHNAVDIVVIKLGEIIGNNPQGQVKFLDGVNIIVNSEGVIVSYNINGARNFDDVEITNNVFIIGYPISLSTKEMNQIDYDSPLARKGIVAGKNHVNKTLIIDCPVYGGNSGGVSSRG